LNNQLLCFVNLVRVLAQINSAASNLTGQSIKQSKKREKKRKGNNTTQQQPKQTRKKSDDAKAKEAQIRIKQQAKEGGGKTKQN
jgi:hypothetical protein